MRGGRGEGEGEGGKEELRGRERGRERGRGREGERMRDKSIVYIAFTAILSLYCCSFWPQLFDRAGSYVLGHTGYKDNGWLLPLHNMNDYDTVPLYLSLNLSLGYQVTVLLLFACMCMCVCGTIHDHAINFIVEYQRF